LNPRQRHPSLDAPLDVDERNLHVNGRCEIRLLRPQSPELVHLTRFGARWPWRSVAHQLGLYPLI
jgi:hypothetical protein